MQRRQPVVLILVAFTALAFPFQGHSAQIEGVTFDDVYSAGDIQLPIQGTGVFLFMGVFKAYAGAIYHEAGQTAETLLGDSAKRLEVEYFYGVRSDYFGPYAHQLLARNVDAATYRMIAAHPGFNKAMNRDVLAGDRYALTYIPGRGTELCLNDQVLAVIPGSDFAAALFSIWLGKAPVSVSFKEQLIGFNQ